jgi:hypothetical protein
MMDKFILIISMILVFYISVNSIQSFSIKFEILDSVIDEYKTSYITDIKVFNHYCDEGYESLVQNSDWPGSYPGCACQTTAGQYQFYIKEFCPSPKCIDVGESKNATFNRWRGKVICIKRDDDVYRELPIVSFDEYSGLNACKNSTHRVCGSIDGKGNLLCMPKQRECPVTNIAIKRKERPVEIVKNITDGNNITKNSTNVTDSDKTIKNSTNESTTDETPNLRNLQGNDLNLTNDYYIELTREPEVPDATSYKIPQFFRIDTTQPCLDPNRSPSSEYFFSLMKKRYDMMCDKYQNGTEITDDLYTPIDTYLLDEFFKDNLYHSTLHGLIDPFKIDISKENIRIYTKSYPGWDVGCRQEQAQFDNFLTYSVVLNNLTVSVIFHSFVSILCLLMIAILACFINNYYDIGFKLVNVGFCVFNLLYPIQIISNCNWIVNGISDYNGNLCGDSSLNILLGEISNSSLHLQYSFILIMLLSFVYSLFFLYTIYRWIKPFNREYQERMIELR